jgi:hypothetical protein
MLRLALLPLLLPGLFLGCKKAPESRPPTAEVSGPVWIEDVTDRLGIDFVHDAGPLDSTYPLPQTTGSGVALFDCDGDGRLDIYLVNNGGPKGRPNKLYRQQPDGTFRNGSKNSGLDFAGYCMGVAVGDVDNDGRPDVLVTLVGGARLFLNKGNGVFQDVTTEAGLDNPAWGASVAFLDFDRDGRLDILIVNYVDFDPTWKCSSARGVRDYCSPNVFPPTISRLFRNVSAKGGRCASRTGRRRAAWPGRPAPALGCAARTSTGTAGWTSS